MLTTDFFDIGWMTSGIRENGHFANGIGINRRVWLIQIWKLPVLILICFSHIPYPATSLELSNMNTVSIDEEQQACVHALIRWWTPSPPPHPLRAPFGWLKKIIPLLLIAPLSLNALSALYGIFPPSGKSWSDRSQEDIPRTARTIHGVDWAAKRGPDSFCSTQQHILEFRKFRDIICSNVNAINGTGDEAEDEVSALPNLIPLPNHCVLIISLDLNTMKMIMRSWQGPCWEWLEEILMSPKLAHHFFTYTYQQFIGGIRPLRLDYIIRFEHYEDDYALLARALGMEDESLSKQNGSTENRGQIDPLRINFHLACITIRRLRLCWRRDIEIFIR